MPPASRSVPSGTPGSATSTATERGDERLSSDDQPHSDYHVLRLTNDHTYSVCLSVRAMMITIIFTGPACSLSALLGAAIHFDCDNVNYVLWDNYNNKYQY